MSVRELDNVGKAALLMALRGGNTGGGGGGDVTPGGDGGNVVIATVTYDSDADKEVCDMTFSEIHEAVENGASVYLMYDGGDYKAFYCMTSCDDSEIAFSSIYVYARKLVNNLQYEQTGNAVTYTIDNEDNISSNYVDIIFSPVKVDIQFNTFSNAYRCFDLDLDNLADCSARNVPIWAVISKQGEDYNMYRVPISYADGTKAIFDGTFLINGDVVLINITITKVNGVPTPTVTFKTLAST